MSELLDICAPRETIGWIWFFVVVVPALIGMIALALYARAIEERRASG